MLVSESSLEDDMVDSKHLLSGYGWYWWIPAKSKVRFFERKSFLKVDLQPQGLPANRLQVGQRGEAIIIQIFTVVLAGAAYLLA
jgi:hypothetical protein